MLSRSLVLLDLDIDRVTFGERGTENEGLLSTRAKCCSEHLSCSLYIAHLTREKASTMNRNLIAVTSLPTCPVGFTSLPKGVMPF